MLSLDEKIHHSYKKSVYRDVYLSAGISKRNDVSYIKRLQSFHPLALLASYCQKTFPSLLIFSIHIVRQNILCKWLFLLPYRTKIRRTKVSKFQLGVENFVRRNILSVENFVQYFNTKVRQKSDKTAEISAWCRKFCPTKYFVRRKFCLTKFCPIRYILKTGLTNY